MSPGTPNDEASAERIREEVLKSEKEQEEAEDQRRRDAEAASVTADNSTSGLMGKAAGAASLAGPEGMAAGAVLSALAAKKKAKEDAKARKKAARIQKGSLFHRMGKKYDNANQSFMQAQRDVAEGFDKHVHPWLFFLVALFLHVLDVINGFDRGARQSTVMFLLYALFTFWAVFSYYRTGLTKESGRYVAVSLVAFVLPYLFLIPLFNKGYLPLILTLLPVWALYIAFEQDSALWLSRGAKLYIILLIFLIFIMLIARVNIPGVSSPAVLIGQSAKRFWTDVTDAWSTIWTKLKNANVFSVAMWKEKINKTFNPAAQFYVGQVEQNQKQPQGVYITKLQSLYPVTYIGQQPAILGRIEAKTFLPGGGVNVTTSCRLDRPGRIGWMGTPDVTGQLQVNEYLPADVTCTFPADPNMTAGTYNGVLGVSFGFETWAYITSTFVSRNTIVNEQQQGRNINNDLDIDPMSTAIYTNGPISVGILADQQPIAIDPDARNENFISQRFGFTIANRWDQGTVKKGSVSAEVLVPEPFELKSGSCLPTAWSGQPTIENGMRHYIFTRSNDLDLDVRNDYRTVTCQLVLPSKQAAEQVLNFGEKTPVTFVVIARYGYDIEERVPVRVEE